VRRNLILTVAVTAALATFAVNADAKTRYHVKLRHAAKPVHAVAKTRHADPVATDGRLALKSTSALVLDQKDGSVLYSKNASELRPIASITKLMTAMVVLDADQPMEARITVEPEDMDLLRGSGSRLAVGTTLSRRDMLQLALMSSENRAAAALGRAYPGGIRAFVAAMNRKAAQLGMTSTHFVDSTGLHSENVSTARDLSKMVRASHRYALIRVITTTPEYELAVNHGTLEYRNTNALVRNPGWHIGVSKTGFINEAGHCLVMQAKIAQRPTIIVLLDSWGKNSRLGDANRIRKWLEANGPAYTAQAKAAVPHS
jgi:D-alanyl-D-alanine carboxypeptidase